MPQIHGYHVDAYCQEIVAMSEPTLLADYGGQYNPYALIESSL